MPTVGPDVSRNLANADLSSHRPRRLQKDVQHEFRLTWFLL